MKRQTLYVCYGNPVEREREREIYRPVLNIYGSLLANGCVQRAFIFEFKSWERKTVL